MDEQDRVAAFVDEYGLETDLAYHALDLESEVGEIAKEVTTSTDYGRNPSAASIGDRRDRGRAVRAARAR